MQESNNILLFDGVCNLCNNTVKFVIRQDKKALIKFASLQSPFGQKILLEHQLSNSRFDSFVYVKKEGIFLKSTAALNLMRDIGGVWTFFYAFIIIPRSIRDFVYDMVAKNRYRWFGKQPSCIIPSAEIKARFLE